MLTVRFSKAGRSSSLPAILLFLAALGSAIQPHGSLAEEKRGCAIEPTSRISSVNQSLCLLRPVLKGADLGAVRTSLPATIGKLMATGSMSINKEQLRRYLKQKGIAEADIGGSLDAPVSRANNNASGAEQARYFIIHDTSSPNYLDKQFPATIDTASWEGNRLSQWLRGEPIAHVFINRLGDSVTPVDFSKPWRTTGYEIDTCGIPCKGLFLGIELVQPRRSDPNGPRGNDMLAPSNGFTEPQLERLAVVYVAASIRRGKWLIPAFHAVLDADIKGGHDDPQNFDLERWDSQLGQVIEAVAAITDVSTGFSLPAPNLSNLSAKNLWATFYHVWLAKEQPSGIRLLGTQGKPISPLISVLDWCKGAIEGTIQIESINGDLKTYNYRDKSGTAQADCRSALNINTPWIDATSRSRFGLANGEFGDGVKDYHLLPFRTIAVDPSFIPYGSVIYIPSFRGQTFRLANGALATHDGYFFAADTGGAIKENHIDIFIGTAKTNPFPSLILSKPSPTLRSFIIADPTIREAMERLHRQS
jgi:3D (Asp-Asp-Asp) domain-containing protein